MTFSEQVCQNQNVLHKNQFPWQNDLKNVVVTTNDYQWSKNGF